jgi:hypothetical protein
LSNELEKGVAPGEELGRGSEAALDDESGGGAVETGRRGGAERRTTAHRRPVAVVLISYAYVCMYVYIYISPSGPTDQNRICNISSRYKSKRENRKQAQQKVQSGVPF